MSHQLCEPITSGGIRNTNFFNGRLLAAEDLQTLQTAERQHRGQLGRAIGSGVVEGLEAALAHSDPFTLSLGAGLAINANGQPLELPAPIDLALTVAPTTSGATGAFVDCSTASPLLATGMGAYALLMAPASAFLQSAPASGLGTGGAITGCGARFQVDGVTFRLVRFDPASLVGLPAASLAAIDDLMSRTDLVTAAAAPPTDLADLSMLRNRLAHACLGTEQVAALPRDPFATRFGSGQSAFAAYGALDALRGAPDGMTDDDVALALVYWTRIGARFVDMWSLRRRPTPPGDGPPWDALLTRRRVEGEAAFRQFQDHADWLQMQLGVQAEIVAQQWFRFLPPVGVVRLGPTALSTGVHLATWLQGLSIRNPDLDPEFMEGASLAALLNDSFVYPAIDLLQPEMIRLYLVHENRRAIDTGALPARSAYLVFANGHLPPVSLARFDLNYFNYANYA